MTNTTSTSVLVDRPLGEIVADDARTAVVLERFGLDYCCNGHQTLADAAAGRNVPLQEVLDALAALQISPAEREDWPDLDFLTRHIVKHHHRYVRETLPVLGAWLDKLVARHGTRHAELEEIRGLFAALGDELTTHMAKEEHLLFPFIDELAAARRAGTRRPPGPFVTVLHPIRVMESDHQGAGDLLLKLRTFTNGYTPPEDACTTFRLCYAELDRFERDLHRHIHLENNILFPKALQLEQELD